jgi:DNA-binding transcriptional MerR regulator
LSREFGTTTRALRFYEEQGLLFPRRRDSERIYSYKDRARLALIMRGRRVGLSVAEIREILDLYDEQGEAAQNAEALRIFRRRIEALEAQRHEVDEAIGALRQASRRLAERFAMVAEPERA